MLTNIRKAGCSGGWMFRNVGFLKSKFSTAGEYRRKRRFLKISVFSSSKFSYLTIDENRKLEFIKVGEKKSAISETSAFSTWPINIAVSVVLSLGERLKIREICFYIPLQLQYLKYPNLFA